MKSVCAFLVLLGVSLSPSVSAVAAEGDAAPAAEAAAKPAPPAEPAWRQMVRGQKWAEANKELYGLLKEAAQKGALKETADAPELYYWYTLSRYAPAFEERARDTKTRDALLAWLEKRRPFAEAFLFALADRDDPGKAFVVLADLVQKFGDKVGDFPGLAIAYATVYATANYEPDVVAAGFQFYAANNAKMVFDLARLPVELCQYVVDGRAPAAEKAWALKFFGGRPDIAALIDAVPFDRQAERDREQGQLRGKPYTLANIQQFGGASQDRVYFATEVGKAIGAPCAPMTAEKDEYVSLWVASLRRAGNDLEWQYGAGTTGSPVRDALGYARGPNGRKVLADELDHAAAAASQTAEQRRQYALHLGIANLLLAGDGGAPPLPGEKAPTAAVASLETAARLAAKAHELDPLALAPWRVMARAAGRLGDKGRPLLDSAFLLLYRDPALARRPFTRIAAFQALLGALADNDFRGRIGLCHDMERVLAAEKAPLAKVILIEGQALIDAGDPRRAFDLLRVAAIQHAADGMVTVDLLGQAEEAGMAAGRTDDVIRMYEGVAAKTPRPPSGPWARGTAFYVIMQRMVKLYRLKGDRAKTDEVMHSLDVLTGGDADTPQRIKRR